MQSTYRTGAGMTASPTATESSAIAGGGYSSHARSMSAYKSNIAPRSTVINRTTTGPSMMTRVSHSYLHSSQAGGFGGAMGGFGAMGMAGLGKFGTIGVPMRPTSGLTGGALVTVNETRMKEKHQLSQLNDKFAQYVEKVRFLEAQNKKLQLELDALQKSATHGSSKIKEMYEIEMNEARKLIDASNRDKANAEMQAKEAESDRDNLLRRYEEIKNSRGDDSKRIELLQREIAENEAKINLMRRRLGDLEDEARRYKTEVQRIVSEIHRVQNDIQNEIFTKSCLESEKMALEDELQMLTQMHDAELNELRSRSFVDSGLEPSQFFRNELANAIREIRDEYESATEQQRNELYNRYMMQYNEICMRHKAPELMPAQFEQQRIQEDKLRTTLTTSRNEIAHMRARNEELNNRIRELQMIISSEKEEGGRSLMEKERLIEELNVKLTELLREHDEVISMKSSLEQEINKYRELLEGSTSHDGLRQIVEHIEEEARKLEAEKMSGSSAAAAGLSALSRISGQLGGVGGSSGTKVYRSVTYSTGGGAGSYGGASSLGGIGGSLFGTASRPTGAYGAATSLRGSSSSTAYSSGAQYAHGSAAGAGHISSPTFSGETVSPHPQPTGSLASSGSASQSYFSQSHRTGGY